MRQSIPRIPRLLERGVWCVGLAEDSRLVLVAVDGRGIWRRVEIVPPECEPTVRRFLAQYLDVVDPPVVVHLKLIS